MAKFGKFVGFNGKAFDSNELDLFRETIDNVFGNVGLTSFVESNDDGIAFFKVKLNDSKKKIASLTKKGDFAYNVSNFKFMVVKSEGMVIFRPAVVVKNGIIGSIGKTGLVTTGVVTLASSP